MKLLKTLKSCEDQSVNFVFDNMLEARFVRRTDDYFICYLSSHTGCNKACRFCHLTQTGQTEMEETTVVQYFEQARHVLEYYASTDNPAKRVNFNFMSRGEVLSNKIFLKEANILLSALNGLAYEYNLKPQYNLSTIMPVDFDGNLSELIQNDFNHNYYYSLYSIDPDFRKRWLPKAMSVDKALEQFAEWQEKTDRTLALHWTFIEGKNDSEEQVKAIMDKIESYRLKCKFNLVRYNPYSEKQGQESSDIVLQRNFDIIASHMDSEGSRIVPRVGFDVKASCGMFVSQ